MSDTSLVLVDLGIIYNRNGDVLSYFILRRPSDGPSSAKPCIADRLFVLGLHMRAPARTLRARVTGFYMAMESSDLACLLVQSTGHGHVIPGN